ncbi:MAG: isoaspartyl peptidase/L-asparaginase [Pseudomonadota bacterium]
MKWMIAGLSALMLGACANVSVETDFDFGDEPMPEWSLAIHGGAGVITRANMSPEREAEMHAGLEAALKAGSEVLEAGGSSLDAVEAAVMVMEDHPGFNAGQGAVFTAAGTHELDASIMVGNDRDAGAVAGITNVKNPIRAARAVMENSEHVMFAGSGADDFAATQGLDLVDNVYFSTRSRQQSLDRVLREQTRDAADRHGTVGAVALDQAGNLAAATSTGGMTAKATGRVGDSPLIGAATYAQNGVCAVSATGHGEYFIRVGVAKTICTQIELADQSIKDAAEIALGEVADLGGDGGVIVMGANGEVALVFDTEGMYRGRAAPGVMETAIFAGED